MKILLNTNYIDLLFYDFITTNLNCDPTHNRFSHNTPNNDRYKFFSNQQKLYAVYDELLVHLPFIDEPSMSPSPPLVTKLELGLSKEIVLNLPFMQQSHIVKCFLDNHGHLIVQMDSKPNFIVFYIDTLQNAFCNLYRE
ncbi:hypothetical protein SAGO17_0004 [Mimivirus AB-566-O17]|uniref:Uncharacterized protein n=1 Tax=Mimivirus AB-566-O17 TaxID=1988039 RepID=A0A1X9VNL6_9VIRU|nr:hypothetical protein SAGO17_0004 [Mimivirus AB-566-O17]